MELKDKVIAFLGDSITYGAGTTDKSFTYPELLKNSLGLKEALNCAMGGTLVAPMNNKADERLWHNPFVDRVESIDINSDVIIVLGGTNDFWVGDIPLGSINDTTVDTFYGAYHVLLQRLINRFYNKQIVVLTPPHRLNETVVKNGKEYAFKSYVNAMKEVAEYFAIPVCDLYATCGIQPKVEILKETLIPDGLHPNDAGHRKIFERLNSFLINL
ncbi:MAG: SGNH/GDSL hydrolase family protein [Clostridia bacterium]|nr:SGNH/GDSL hydrolase family protein [Clostridia bacterium]